MAEVTSQYDACPHQWPHAACPYCARDKAANEIEQLRRERDEARAALIEFKRLYAERDKLVANFLK